MRTTLPSPGKMSCDAALSVFHQEGEYPSQATLRQSWLRLLKKYHEVGTTPNPERLTLINAARDVLRTCGDDVLPIAHTSALKTYVVWAWRGEHLVKGVTVEILARAILPNRHSGVAAYEPGVPPAECYLATRY